MPESNAIESKLATILFDVLGKTESELGLTTATAILGAIPEFDSMAVVSVLTAAEEEFDIVIDDDEVDASAFETFGTLVEFVTGKVAD